MSDRADPTPRPAWERPGRFERAAGVDGAHPADGGGRTGQDGVAPPGWPRGVRPPGVDGWEETAVRWLYELVPPGYRRHEVLRRHPPLLARMARQHVTAALQAARYGYSTARLDLRDREDVNTIEALLRAYEYEGARAAALEREVTLVEEALIGKRWNPRL
ncbi:hypothetical protein [Yinghuangia seranimata]|uniref:hypothetical protein n=1 Tax=Yinghuangia seranimata TaxID=408067 RepID=UPI00248AD8BC|nr:hypothetical protein [Yinghuangia seranimata]MDI2132174.1 hypothetical protein [Yinghuangia seranimata]